MAMSKGMAPRLHHRLMRQIGIGFCGLKGVDWLLRRFHSPDQRGRWHINTEGQSIWQGPRFHLETRWFTEWNTYFYGSQDRALHGWMRRNIQSDWVCFDVGTNFGFFACVCAQLSRETHGFEPVELLLRRAEQNRALNGLKNLYLNQVALSAATGHVDFHLPSEESPNWGTGSLVHDQRGRVVRVKTITLDSYCQTNAIERLDFIKIDVEGAEHLVLEGAEQSLAKYRPAIIFENNADSAPAAVGRLRKHRYVISDLAGNEFNKALPSNGQCSDFLATPNPH
jgi:FkbM family methyltransferase